MNVNGMTGNLRLAPPMGAGPRRGPAVWPGPLGQTGLQQVHVRRRQTRQRNTGIKNLEHIHSRRHSVRVNIRPAKIPTEIQDDF